MKLQFICYLYVLGSIAYAQTENTRMENFKHPPLKYHMNLNTHGYPLEEERQIALLDDYLLSGYGGLATNVNWTDDYLKNDRQLSAFFRFVRLAKERNLEVWLYDENLYPSGMAGEYILEEHPDWEAEGLFFKDTVVDGGSQVRMNVLPGKIRMVKAFPVDNDLLHFDKGQDLQDRIKDGTLEWKAPAGQWKIGLISTGVLYEGFQAGTERGGKIPRYTSLLMPEVTTRFIDLTHKKYADFLGDKLGSLFFSTFTDEPSAMAIPYYNLGYGVYPWKNNVSEAFKKRYGCDLEEQLMFMALDEGRQGQKVRTQYFSVIADFMSRYYFKPVKEFCRQQGFKSGGHLLLEESMMAHVPLYGNIMSCFREMDVPGIDVLTGMPDYTPRYLISGRLAASAAELEGNSMVMSEVCPVYDFGFHAGTEAPTLHAKGTINRQLIAGVDKFNNYLRLRHEDAAGKKAFNEYIARICMMMSGGTRASRIAVYYPIETLWAKYRPLPSFLLSWDDVQGGDEAAQQLDRLFVGLSNTLFENHREFSYIDAKGIVDNDLLKRDVLILPGVETIPVEAMGKIVEFCKRGGKVIAIESLPVNSLSDFPSETIKKLVSDISEKHIYFEQTFHRDNLEDLLSRFTKKELTIHPKENVLCSHKVIDGKNVYLITNDNSRHKELVIKSNNGQPLMLWNPQTGDISSLNNSKKISLGPFESIIITNN